MTCIGTQTMKEQCGKWISYVMEGKGMPYPIGTGQTYLLAFVYFLSTWDGCYYIIQGHIKLS